MDGLRAIAKPLAACSLPVALAVVSIHLVRCAGTRLESDGGTLAGSDRCASCHEQETRFCRYGPHRTIECEECHGPGGEHARAETGSRPGMVLGDVELCLSCHREGADRSREVVSTIGSFEDHLRALEREHRIELDRRKSGADCVYCHDPHLLE